MRFVDGSSHNEGRVEVYYNGRWGTVCNSGWNDLNSKVICAQLGFESSGKLTYFGPGSGSIFLENVICSVNNTILANCGHYGVGITVQCNHNNDAGIKCYGKTLCMHVYKSYNTVYVCVIKIK